MPKGFKLNTPLKYIHYAKVVPGDKVLFPIHLLTSQQAYPDKEWDSSNINCGRYGDFCDRPIQLIQFGPTETPSWRAADWQKAGWELEILGQAGFAFGHYDKVEKIGQSLKYIHAAIVKPVRGFSFPIDMLRYDRCFPYKEVDAVKVARMTHEFDAKAEPVRVVQYLEAASPRWTYDRWLSFGWEIEEVPYTDFVLAE